MSNLKFVNSVEVNVPLSALIKIWKNESFFGEWQDGFVSKTMIKGIPYQSGSEAELVFVANKRTIKLHEKVLVEDLPLQYLCKYEHIHMTNTQDTRFEVINSNKTRYISEIEYTEFHGFIPKLMKILSPSIFQKQSQKWMNQFKEFAEKQHLNNEVEQN